MKSAILSNHYVKSHRNNVFYLLVSVLMAFLLVFTLLPNQFFSYLGVNTVQKAFADSNKSDIDNVSVTQFYTKPLWDNPKDYEDNAYELEQAKDENQRAISTVDENWKSSPEYEKWCEQQDNSEDDESDNFDFFGDSKNSNAVLATISIDGGASFDVSDDAGLQKAVEETAKGKKIVVDMKNNHTLKSRLYLNANTNCTLNLHGYYLSRGLTSRGQSKDGGEVIYIGKNVTLTVNGGDTPDEMSRKHNITGYKNVSDDTQTYEIEGGVICNGSSQDGAGGIHYGDNDGTVYLNNTRLFGCYADCSDFLDIGLADGHGGAVYFNGQRCRLFMNNSSIERCGSFCEGGAIYINSGHHMNCIYMTNSSISYNYSRDHGGVLYDGAGQNSIVGDAKFSDTSQGSTFAENIAKDDGGAIFCWLDDVGGDIWAPNNVTTVYGINFIRNNAKNGQGGAAKIYEETLSFTNCNFESNSADEAGGAIYIDDACNLTNCYIVNNKCGEYGNVLVDDKGDKLNLSGDIIINNNFRGNVEKDVYLWHDKAYITPSVSRSSLIGIDRSDIDDNKWIVESPGGYDANCFFSNDGGYHIEYDQSEFRLKFASGGGGKPEPLKVKEIAPISNGDPEAETDLRYASKDTGQEYPVYRYTTSYSIMTNSDDYLSTYYYYSDGFFSEDPSNYNDHLASLSMTGEISCSKHNDYFPGDYSGNIDYSRKEANIAQFFSNIGCNQQDIYVNDKYLIQPTESSIGCAIASKQLTIINEDGEEDDSYILMPIVVRGMGYEAEWASNFTLGTEGAHEGFSKAADEVLQNIDIYLNNYNLMDKAREGKIKFWMMGHSRAGATSNLASKRLTDKYGIFYNQIYTYTFEPPLCADAKDMDLVIADYTYNGEYANIHNIVNSADPVVYIPEKEMGFSRYGVSHYIPGKEGSDSEILFPEKFDNDNLRPTYNDSSSEYVKLRNKMVEQYHATNGYENYCDYFHSYMLYLPGWHLWDFGITTKGNLTDATQFCDDFIYQLFYQTFEANGLSPGDTMRDAYFYKHNTYSGYKEDFQTSITKLLKMLMSKNPTEFNEILNAFTSFLGNMNLLEAAYMALDYLMNPYEDDCAEELAEMIVDMMIEKTPTLDLSDYLTDEELNIVKESVYQLLCWQLQSFVRWDIKDSKKVLEWDVNKDDYFLPIIMTAAQRIMAMFTNHFPECSLAWVRACDDYYSQNPEDLECVKVTESKSPQPEQVKLRYEDDNPYVSGEIVHLDRSNTIQLFTDDNQGQVIYYNIEETDNPDDVADPTITWESNHYQTNITFQRKGPNSVDLCDLTTINEFEEDTTYTIKAVSYGYLKHSEISTFTVVLHNGNVITIHSPTYDTYGHNIVQRVVEGSNVVFGTDNYYNEEKFIQWRAYRDANKFEEITDEIFDISSEEACNQNINVTWIKMPKYDIWIDADYGDVPDTSEIRLDFDNFNIEYGQTLPEKATPSYTIEGHELMPFNEVDLIWYTNGEDGNMEKINNPSNEVIEPGKDYKFEINLQLDKATGFILKDQLSYVDLYLNGKKLNKEFIEIDHCDYSLDKPNWKLSYSIVKEVEYISQSFNFGDDMYIERPDNEGVVEEMAQNMWENTPDEITVQTSRGDLNFTVPWVEGVAKSVYKGLLLHTGSEAIDYFMNSGMTEAYLPDYILQANDIKVPFNACFIIHLAKNGQACIPFVDIKPNTYEKAKDDYISVGLNNVNNLSMAYTFDDPETVDSPIWYTYDEFDKIKIYSKTEQNVEQSIWVKTNGGSIDSKTYTESLVCKYSYIVNEKDFTVYTLNTNHFDVINESPLITSESKSFIASDLVTFTIKSFDGYEFQYWEEELIGQATPVITADNKFSTSITFTNINRNVSVKAIYAPVIEEVEAYYDLPLANSYLASNVSKITIKTKYGTDTYTEVDDINEFTELKWIYADGEITSDIHQRASFNTQYLASISIKENYFENKGCFVPWQTKISTIGKGEGMQEKNILSSYYSLGDEKSNNNQIRTFHINALPDKTLLPKLLWVDEFANVENVMVYTSLSDIVNYYLQSEVAISVEGALVSKANIYWYQELVTDYDPSNWDEQQFTIKGKVIIPSYIDNGTEDSPFVPVVKTCNVSVNGLSRVAAPTVYPGPGKYKDNISATLETSSENCTIYYKLICNDNPEEANDDFIPFTDPIELSADPQTVKSYALECYTKENDDNFRPSLITKYKYTIDRIYVETTEVVMDPEYVDVEVYDSFDVLATVLPEDSWDNNISYSSSDLWVASIHSKTGSVQTYHVGECELYGTTLIDSKVGVTKLIVHGLTYDFLDKPNTVYTLTSNELRQFIIEAESNRFVGITVDGEKIDNSKFEFDLIPLPEPDDPDVVKAALAEGEDHPIEPPYDPEIDTQTVVRLLPNFLETLAAGEHEIVFNFNDGDATINLTVDKPEFIEAGAGTYDNFQWIWLLFVLIVFASCVLIVNRRYNKK